jgi:hypothetical protein
MQDYDALVDERHPTVIYQDRERRKESSVDDTPRRPFRGYRGFLR